MMVFKIEWLAARTEYGLGLVLLGKQEYERTVFRETPIATSLLGPLVQPDSLGLKYQHMTFDFTRPLPRAEYRTNYLTPH